MGKKYTAEEFKKLRPNSSVFSKDNQPKNKGNKKGKQYIVPKIKSLLAREQEIEAEGILVTAKAKKGDKVKITIRTTTADQVAAILIEKAVKDRDIKSLQTLIEHVDGKAIQKIELDNEQNVLHVETTQTSKSLGSVLAYIADAKPDELIKIKLAAEAKEEQNYYKEKQKTDK